MAKTHATDKAPYLERQISPDKFGDLIGIFTSYAYKHFSKASSAEHLFYHKDQIEQIFNDINKRLKEKPQTKIKLILKRFYHEVFDENISMEEIKIPIQSSWSSYHIMYVSPLLTVEKLIHSASRLFGVETQGLQDCWIQHRFQQTPKLKSYMFFYLGYRTHDTNPGFTRMGDDELAQDMNSFEYLLTGMLQFWMLGKFYDDSGKWTLLNPVNTNEFVIGQYQPGSYVFRKLESEFAQQVNARKVIIF